MDLLIPVVLTLTAVGWHIGVFRVSPRLGLVKPNFNKQPIMASYGIVSFAYVAAAVCSLAAMGGAQWSDAGLYLGVMGVMWALGAIDDIYGTREVGGFRGHFRKLLRERKLTTGAAKALGGGVVGLAAGWIVSGGDLVRWVPAALVIPLAANVLNLVDLRPGRAAAVFFLGLGVICIAELGRLQAPWVVGAVAAVAFAWALVDSRGRAMMGDSGSNSLGAALGLTIVLSTGLAFQAAAVVCLVAIHWYSEKHSIAALIERNAVLRGIDGRLGVR